MIPEELPSNPVRGVFDKLRAKEGLVQQREAARVCSEVVDERGEGYWDT